MKFKSQLGAWAVAASLAIAAASPAVAQTTIKLITPENNEGIVGVWNGLIKEYESAHPDVKIDFEYLASQSMQEKMPTMLQSDAAPDTFYTWGGGIMKALVETGQLADITPQLMADDGAWYKSYVPAAVEAFALDGKHYAVPYKFSVISFYYNRALFADAGIEGDSIKTWSDLLGAVEKLKTAGITPIALGGKDKWPIHFYFAYLAMREGGADVFANAKAGEDGGFESESFVNAGQLLQDLAHAGAFQRGYEAALWGESLSDFADGRAAMILGFSGLAQSVPGAATDGKGLPVEDIGLINFPVVEGGKGVATETFGGNNGWVVNVNAPPETTDFLKFAMSPENQRKFAALNSIIPVVPNTSDAITDPTLKIAADIFSASTFHQNYLDQDLGPVTGFGVVNQQVFDLVTDNVTPEDAAAAIERSWQMEQ